VSIKPVGSSELYSILAEAWENVWMTVKLKPKILLYRETHVHVLLGHEILKILDERKLFEEIDVVFDDKCIHDVDPFVSFGLSNATRPDVWLRAIKMNENVVAQLKILRSDLYMAQRFDESKGEDEQHTIFQNKRSINDQVLAIKRDLHQLSDYPAVLKGPVLGVMCIFHFHHTRYSEISEIDNRLGALLKWQDSFPSEATIVRQALGKLPPFDSITDPFELNKFQWEEPTK
jgi:hypothetical protein